ncbi:hypothetical protein [Nocardia sp. XZ_19_369]|uniref:hypothetical protein n=1 Tax=Nocardia sp. XZ_19_369 TaxID=2769487 RepID=UPI0018908EA7|nr:hypothetical protein [Nocardia sp. XZ_19_369]
MADPYGRPGNSTSTHQGLTGVITILSAWLGAAAVGMGSLAGFQHFRVVDRITEPKITDDKYEAWKLASQFHSVLQVLLIVSVLMAGLLALGNLLSMLGKPAGRQMEIIGAAWLVVGGLISVTYGGDYGLSDSFILAAMIIIGAALALISLVLTVTTAPIGSATPQAPAHYVAPMPYQPPHP